MAKTKLAYINDPDVWNYIESLTNFSSWVREKARSEMRGDDIESIVERIVNAKMAGRQVAVSQVIPASVAVDACDVDQFF